MSDKLSGQRLQAWQKLQAVTEQLRRETGRMLSDEAGLSEAEFTVLAHLAATPHGVRSVTCAREMGWDTSRLSHQLRRLEQRGYIARHTGSDPGDGRASVVALTTEGRRAYKHAVEPHLQAAAHWFGEALTDAQVDALYDALTAIEIHVERRIAAIDGDRTDQNDNEKERQ
ncbi:MarR family winged helix-turn-helix transcriptional regulator [Microbacterium sp.]|uniref:MarR family winged helix-turn-helix transcriptional regulator n=1 Tax=Microbacterium sp. TaxID=51671 RepID=UPI003A94AF01